MKKVVVLTGAGISAESGLKTFRDSGGLWEGYDVAEVATPEAWHRGRSLVLEFYNHRRKQAVSSEPNPAHFALADLENYFDVTIITQNIDNLHEKGGSSNVLHLHGEISKARSTVDPRLIYEIDGWELKEGDTCEKGSQLRPHIVWFGEAVPMMDVAIEQAHATDLFIVAGTSLAVYPAASLLDFVSSDVPTFIIDPKIPDVKPSENMFFHEEPASTGVPKVCDLLIREYL